MNKLVIGQGTESNIEAKLGITTEEGFSKFIDKLLNLDISRSNSGFTEHGNYSKIANTLKSFDQIIFDDSYNSTMHIDDFSKLGSEQWVLRGMIEAIASSIDENYRYGCSSPDHDFLCNLRDFLCICTIKY